MTTPSPALVFAIFVMVGLMGLMTGLGLGFWWGVQATMAVLR